MELLKVKGNTSHPCLLQINGASGKMGRAVAEAALEAGVPLVPYGITGPGLPSETLTFAAPPSSGAAPEEVSLEVVPAEERDAVLDKALQQWPGLIIVDYTLPSAVNGTFLSACTCSLQLLYIVPFSALGGDGGH